MERITVGLKLTVILRIHDRTQFFRSAFGSILNQTYDANLLEIIVLTNLTDVSDYFSNFNSLNLAVYNYKDSSVAEVLWEGIGRSSGDVICFLDDDDLWRAGRLEKVHNMFMEYEKVGYYHNSVEPFTDMSNHVERKLYEVARNQGSLYVTNSHKRKLTRKITGYYPDFNMSSICIRRGIISKRLEQLRSLRTSPDTFIYFCALENDCDLFLDIEQLTLYRHHSLNLTKNTAANENWSHAILDSHLFLYDTFSVAGTYLKKLALRRLILTKIQILLRGNKPSSRKAVSYAVIYLEILFSFLIPVDALVFSVLLLSILSHNIAQKIYFRYT